MHALRRYGMILTLLLAGAICAQAVRADELLVMPYSCKVVGGRPTLRPSEDHGHPVIGKREQQEFRACSPADPRLCRNWTVHRFALDCGGVRVPWIDVAAAAGTGGEEQAFVADGHFEIEMPARWSLPPDAPCARGGDIEGPGFRRFCAERLARAPRVTVTMPRGFAPMLGVDGIFVKDQAPRGAVADSSPARRDEPIPEPVANPHRSKPARSEAVARALPKEPPAAQASREIVEAPPPKAPPPAAPLPAKPDPVADGSAAQGAAPVIPQIINGANAPRPTPRSESGPAETGALPDRLPSPSVNDTTVQSEVAGSDASIPDKIASAEHDDTQSLLPGMLSGTPLAMNTVVVTVGTLAVLTLLTIGFMLRRGRTSAAPMLSRDISAVSLERGASSEGQGDTKSALAIVPEPIIGRGLDASPSLSSGPPALIGDAMPRTRAEALEVLGMGIAPDVNEAAIKKIIDGLRLSWHPDHARDPEDRAMRETRLKQINAAWEIITGKRAG